MVQYITFTEGINMQLDPLYKLTKTGAIQVCNISANGDTVTVEFGQLNGKMQSKSTVCTAKNLGRSNQTSPEQQAILEAQAKHVDKIKSGYSTDISAPVTVQLPQKVKPYLDNKHLVKYPAFTTPKLNGVNGTYWLIDNQLTLTSRGGETYPAIPHLEDQIKQAMEFLQTDCLNGELYIHGEHLQDIQSAVKKPNKLSPKLQFHIFELPNINQQYQAKSTLFGKLNTTLGLSHVIGITPTVITSHEEATHWYNIHMLAGFEGSVIYNMDATYQFNIRSSSVLKYKGTLDLEVKLLSYNVDKNGHPVFNAIYNGKEFKVKPKGTDKERKDIISNFESQYKDQYYTIEYECLSRDGTPLKPVGIGLRTCDAEGNPLI
jgi:DNA ligase-1